MKWKVIECENYLLSGTYIIWFYNGSRLYSVGTFFIGRKKKSLKILDNLIKSGMATQFLIHKIEGRVVRKYVVGN